MAKTQRNHQSTYSQIFFQIRHRLDHHLLEEPRPAFDAAVVMPYDEALKVRERRNAPGEYANTIANKANCLANLPDDPEEPDAGNPRNLSAAWTLYGEARDIFRQLGDLQKAEAVGEALRELEQEFPSMPLKANGAH